MSLLSYMPPPRLCHLKKWPTFAGYGFNLHAEKGKAGQYIGKVDPDSPAELGGLKPNDYLIEVNGTNVEDQTHQKVVEKVKEMSDMVNMLVIDVETYKYCKEKGIILSSDMPEVVTHFTPDTQPSKSSNSHQEIQSVTASEQPQEEPLSSEFQTIEEQKADTPTDSSIIEVEEEEVADLDSVLEAVEHSQPPYQRSESPSIASSRQQQPSQAGSGAASAATATGNGSSAAASKDPVANISLDEMRSRVGNNKRNQVKMNPTSFSDKMHLFQAL